MKDLNEQGHYKVTEELLRKLQSEFSCGCCDDDAAGRTIGKVWAREKYLLDPHTAVAWTVADQFSPHPSRRRAGGGPLHRQPL